MKKYIFLLLISLMISPYIGYSQYKLQSQICDTNNNEVPLANISINHTDLGTISNPEGKFEISFPKKHKKLNLKISKIGFQTTYFPLDSLLHLHNNKQDITLTLHKRSYQLTEVIVKFQNILHDPILIIKKAIQNLPNTLANTPHNYKGFYRQTHYTDTTTNKLTECAITIFDPGVPNSTKYIKANIDQIKTSLDNRKFNYKTLLHSYNYNNKTNKINDSINLNDTNIQKHLVYESEINSSPLLKYIQKESMVRNYSLEKIKRGKFLNPKFIKEHQFKLDSIFTYQDDFVYKIKILPNPRFNRHKGWGKSIIPVGKLYIRAKDYAILQMEYALIQNPKRKNQYIINAFGRSTFYNVFIKYQDINGKMYLSFISSNLNDRTASSVDPWINKDYYPYVTKELIVYKVITNIQKDNSTNLKQKWNTNLYKDHSYNAEYWKNHSSMIETEKQKKMRKALEQEIAN